MTTTPAKPPEDKTEAHSDSQLTNAQLARLKRYPKVAIIRLALGLTQEEFSTRYRIPIGTLRDWEQGRVTPDAPARAYLAVIAKEPRMVASVFEEVA
ncbi:MAG: transcriptional regulator [Rhizobiales bacterium PAR1]|nr:MAG: transcriptional regulator [Rhizobiales bacterium PAR1]